jgi:hypothetical protein
MDDWDEDENDISEMIFVGASLKFLSFSKLKIRSLEL